MRRGDFQKNPTVTHPCCESQGKDTALSRTAVGYSETNWQQRTQQLQRPFIHYIPHYWRNERSAMLATARWWQSKKFYWVLKFNICKHLSCFSHSFPSLCVTCTVPIYSHIQYSLAVQVEGGRGGLQREWGTWFQPLKKPTEQIKKSRLSLRRDDLHPRVGNLFPKSQQPYETALYLLNP